MTLAFAGLRSDATTRASRLLNGMRILLVTVLALVVSGSAARADLVWHDAYKNPFSSWSAYMYDHNVKRHLRERTASTPQPPRAPLTATDFRRDPRRADVVAQLIAASGLRGPDATALATQLRATMAQLASAGRKDNVASALALTIGLSLLVVEAPDFEAEQADALVGVVNDVLAGTPQFTQLGGAQRQLMYDSLLLSAAVIVLVHQSGDKAASQAMARQVLQQLIGAS